MNKATLQFDFTTASRILFGPGKVRELPGLARALGNSALFVLGKDISRYAGLLKAVEERGIGVSVLSVDREPTVDLVRSSVPKARKCQMLIAIGGGSVIDTAKAVAAIAANSGEPLDYLEVVGHGKPLENHPLPWIAIPTTAGTGAEVTRNAVLDSPAHGVKASLRHASMLATVAVVDPELTLNLPPEITAYTGLDALTQLIEPYVSIRANPLTDLFCLEGLKRVSRSLRTAFENGQDRQAREDTAFASLLGGLALANAGLGVVHGFAAPLGGMLHAPHGALCAAVLPAGMKVNIQALRKRQPDAAALDRYRIVARILTGNAEAEPEQGSDWVAGLCRTLRIRGLADYGFQPEQIPGLIEKASQASSMKANPVLLQAAELSAITEESF